MLHVPPGVGSAPADAPAAGALMVRRCILEGDAKRVLASRQPAEEGPAAAQPSQSRAAADQLLSEAAESYAAAGAASAAALTEAGSGGDGLACANDTGHTALRLALLCNDILRVCHCLQCCSAQPYAVPGPIYFTYSILIPASHAQAR